MSSESIVILIICELFFILMGFILKNNNIIPYNIKRQFDKSNERTKKAIQKMLKNSAYVFWGEAILFPFVLVIENEKYLIIIMMVPFILFCIIQIIKILIKS